MVGRTKVNILFILAINQNTTEHMLNRPTVICYGSVSDANESLLLWHFCPNFRFIGNVNLVI